MTDRNPNPELWDKVQKLAQNDVTKIESVDIIFKQQYELPPENIELIKKLAMPDQPKNVRLHIAKNLAKYVHIPYGMHTDLYEILSEDPEMEVKYLVAKTEIGQLAKSIQPLLAKIQPIVLSKNLESLTKRQKELQNSLLPLFQLKNTAFVKQLDALNKSAILNRLNDLQAIFRSINFAPIRIPQTQFDVNDILPKETKQKDISVDMILTQAAESSQELKDAIESKKKLDDLEKKIDQAIDDRDKIIKELLDIVKQINEKQDKTDSFLNRKLSLKQTISIALVVGLGANILSAIIFKIMIEPTIINISNSTLP